MKGKKGWKLEVRITLYENVSFFFLHSLSTRDALSVSAQSLLSAKKKKKKSLLYLRVEQEVRPSSFHLNSQELFLGSWREGAEQQTVRRSGLEAQLNA